MKQHIHGALLALLLLFSLSGCSALPVWEEFLEQEGLRPTPDSSPAKPSPVPTAAPSVTPPPFPVGEETPEPEYIEEPEYPEPIPYEELSLELLQDEIMQSGNKVGLAFLGYVDSQSSEVDLRDYIMYSDAGSKYPFLLMSGLLMVEGQELYVIVPPDEMTSITVYASGVGLPYIAAHGLPHDHRLAQSFPAENLIQPSCLVHQGEGQPEGPGSGMAGGVPYQQIVFPSDQTTTFNWTMDD